MLPGKLYLIPSLLSDDGQDAIPPYIVDAVKTCSAFFVEEERTARRYLKKIWKEIVIDDYEWFNISEIEKVSGAFRTRIAEGKTVGIISEAGCPGIADPGQVLVAIAQEINAEVKPLTGPNSIMLALMASGMNGQQFYFAGYLPIAPAERAQVIRQLESVSAKNKQTQIFIETPYRNNQMIETILKTCAPQTRLCLAADLTGSKEWIKTKTVADWKKELPDLHKRPVIFLLYAGAD
jgi:16S rRNA (cytidine1402-2'-O)-methyltransferase